MKNLAGNNVSIFLFRFVLRNNGISFVLNETIAEDMYPGIDAQLQPLVQVCSETLLRYKHQCHEEVIMDGNILADNCFEVMLSPGLGKHFAVKEKQNLFNDANEIAHLLMEVMDRRTTEIKQGTYPGPQSVIPEIMRSHSTNPGLEALGKKHSELEDLPEFASQRASLKRLRPDDLPQGVIARRGYDHRGRCYAFEHDTLGDLGKIILIDLHGNTLLEAELHTGNSGVLPEKKQLFEEIIAIVEEGLRNAGNTR